MHNEIAQNYRPRHCQRLLQGFDTLLEYQGDQKTYRL